MSARANCRFAARLHSLARVCRNGGGPIVTPPLVHPSAALRTPPVATSSTRAVERRAKPFPASRLAFRASAGRFTASGVVFGCFPGRVSCYRSQDFASAVIFQASPLRILLPRRYFVLPGSFSLLPLTYLFAHPSGFCFRSDI